MNALLQKGPWLKASAQKLEEFESRVLSAFLFFFLWVLSLSSCNIFSCHFVQIPRWVLQEVKTDGCEVVPPVLPSPTNSQRQPMMPRSFRSVRSAVHGANWAPEVSSALATSIPMRAPQRPGFGYQRPVLEMNVEDLPCIPQPSLETPTYSQRQPMMSRSNCSMRNQVMTAADAETIPAVSPPSAPMAAAPMAPTPTASNDYAYRSYTQAPWFKNCSSGNGLGHHNIQAERHGHSDKS